MYAEAKCRVVRNTGQGLEPIDLSGFNPYPLPPPLSV